MDFRYHSGYHSVSPHAELWEIKEINIRNYTHLIILTWSRYFAWSLYLAEHILQAVFVDWSGYISWLTMMLWVSIWHFVNSCTSLSVSYNDRNSDMQTHTKVVCSWEWRKMKMKVSQEGDKKTQQSDWQLKNTFSFIERRKIFKKKTSRIGVFTLWMDLAVPWDGAAYPDLSQRQQERRVVWVCGQ